MRRPLLLGTFAALIAASLVSACGADEQTFSPQGFIDEMNANGAALELGHVLTTTEDGVDVHVVTLTGLAPSVTGQPSPPSDTPTSATLVVLADADGARDEFERCERTGLLTCFRAANVVLRAEDLEAADQARITTAIEALATEDS